MKTHLLSAAIVVISAASALAADLMATDPFAFATNPTAKAGAAYIPVMNHGPADRLIDAASDVAKRVEIHQHLNDGDVMKMRQVVDGLPIGNHAHIEMAPGGVHVMLMGLIDPLIEGKPFNVTLVFASGTEIAVSVPVVDRAKHNGNTHGKTHDHKAMHKAKHGTDHGVKHEE